jgi:hypothetical protein
LVNSQLTQFKEGETNMAMLTGNVKSVRVVDGTYKTGKRQGEEWEFLALEIIDGGTGAIWSCQLASEDSSYAQASKGDLVGHKVRCKIVSQSAGPRALPDGREVMQIRSQVRKVEDMGVVDANE